MNPAEFAHEIWARWEKYKKSKSIDTNGGDIDTISGQCSVIGDRYEIDDYERWQRQMETPYDELPEEEKKSDKEIAAEWARVILEDAQEYFGGFDDVRQEQIEEYIKHIREE